LKHEPVNLVICQYSVNTNPRYFGYNILYSLLTQSKRNTGKIHYFQEEEYMTINGTPQAGGFRMTDAFQKFSILTSDGELKTIQMVTDKKVLDQFKEQMEQHQGFKLTQVVGGKDEEKEYYLLSYDGKNCKKFDPEG
jgi:hypothetical protein